MQFRRWNLLPSNVQKYKDLQCPLNYMSYTSTKRRVVYKIARWLIYLLNSTCSLLLNHRLHIYVPLLQVVTSIWRCQVFCDVYLRPDVLPYLYTNLRAVILLSHHALTHLCNTLHVITSSSLVIISIQPEGRFWQEPEPSQATGMVLAHCILGSFLGVACHCFPPPLDVPTFASRCLHVQAT